MKIRMIVATHKPYWMPEDPVYLPVQVGAAGRESLSFQRDDEGENISAKNPHYCELTGLYWAWKNLDADYIGLVHYRRYFSGAGADKKSRILSRGGIEKKLREADILLPKPRHYWIETNYSQYVHAHHREDLEKTREILLERYPEYIPAYDRVMKKRSGHRFNMLVMKKEILDQYCAWLFDVLFTLEGRLDISGYSDNDRRVFGFVGERLLDSWLETKRYPYRNIPYVFLENQNWWTKGTNFIKRKLKAKQS